MAEADRPSVIVLRSHIGWPSPKYTDTAKAHGEAIGLDNDEVRAIKSILGLDPDEHFVVPDDVLESRGA
jgi:transketolase